MTDKCKLSKRTPSQKWPRAWKDGRAMMESHLRWEEKFKRSWPKGLQAHMTCGNSRCVNPSHVVLIPRNSCVND